MNGEFDADGYPTEGTLEKIRIWPLQNFRALIEFVGELWRYPEYWEVAGRKIEAHTGGWSGNEEIIGALKGNQMFWSCCWQSSKRGGHYEFELLEALDS